MKNVPSRRVRPTNSQEERRSLFPLAVSLRRLRLATRFSLGISLALLFLAVPDACAQPFTSTNSVQDFNTLGVVGNKNPYGIFGEDGIMLVSDREGKIYSYSLETKERQDSNDTSDDFVLYRVVENSRTNIHPYGIWSNGTTLWAAHNAHIQKKLTGRNSKIYAYEMTWVTNGMKRYLTGTRDSSKDIELEIKKDEEVTALPFLDYGRERKPELVIGGETIETNNALYGNYSPSGIWSDGETMYVADTGENIIHSIIYDEVKYSARFSSTNKIYAYNMWKTNSSGERQFDGSYNSSKDIRLRDGNTFAQGLWSDGETMWVADFQGKADSAEKKIYAYKLTLEEGETEEKDRRVPEKDYNNTLNEAGNDRPRGIWSDGETMWVADQTDNKLYAYYAFRSPTTRNDKQDFETLAAGNNAPKGMWSDGETLWVANSDTNNPKLYAYDLATKQRDSSKDFGHLGSRWKYPSNRNLV